MQGQPSEKAPEPSFEAFYGEYFGFAWRCLRALGVLPGAVDDAVQEVFLVVHRRLHEFRGEACVKTWLYAIIRNVASNHRRGQERRRLFELALARAPGRSSRDPLESLEDRETIEFVRRFMAKLSPEKRDIFILVMLEEMSVPDVAAALGILPNTAYTRLRTVRQDFARALARKRGQP